MSCQCHAATVRAYRELRSLGRSEADAYAAAVRIFRHYHPKTSRLEAFQEVADWLDHDEAGARA